MKNKLGRKISIDPRDKKYLIKNILPARATAITSRYWGDNTWWGDQGNTSSCVGYAWAHWIEDGPVLHEGRHPNLSPIIIYNEAKKLDDFPGVDYDGTSVRGAAKYLKSSKKITSYLWAFDIDTLINTVLTKGPVVVGTNWHTAMFFPDKNGLIRASGPVEGGHAYVINGVDTRSKLFRIKNSWGKSWGKDGRAFISFVDMSKLIRAGGEVCLAIEAKF
jgi:hypothetical protein